MLVGAPSTPRCYSELHPCSSLVQAPSTLFIRSSSIQNFGAHPSCIHPCHSFELHPPLSLVRAASTLVTRLSRTCPCHSFELHPLPSLVRASPALVTVTRSSAIHPCHHCSFQATPALVAPSSRTQSRRFFELHPHLVTLLSSIHACPSFKLHPKLWCSFKLHPPFSLVQAASTLVTRSNHIYPPRSFEPHLLSLLV